MDILWIFCTYFFLLVEPHQKSEVRSPKSGSPKSGSPEVRSRKSEVGSPKWSSEVVREQVQSPGGFARGGTVFRGLQPSEARLPEAPPLKPWNTEYTLSEKSFLAEIGNPEIRNRKSEIGNQIGNPEIRNPKFENMAEVLVPKIQVANAGSDVVNGVYAVIPDDDTPNEASERALARRKTAGREAQDVSDDEDEENAAPAAPVTVEYMKVNPNGSPFLNSEGGNVQITYSGQYGVAGGFWIIAFPPYQTLNAHVPRVLSSSMRDFYICRSSSTSVPLSGWTSVDSEIELDGVSPFPELTFI